MSPIETIIIARTISVNVISLIKSKLIKTPIIYVKYTTLIVNKLIYHQEVKLSEIFKTCNSGFGILPITPSIPM